MRFYLSGLFLIALFATACGDAPKDDKTVTELPAAPPPPQAPASDLGEQRTGEFMAMIASYYELKDALVATNPAKADVAASRVLSAAEGLNHGTPGDDANKTIKAYLDTVMTQAEAIVNVKDETCEQKRAYFEKVSDGVYGIAKAVNLKNGGVYRQYCPMAFNDKGAFWLSNESEIKNPYFGRKMLECGEVTDSL